MMENVNVKEIVKDYSIYYDFFNFRKKALQNAGIKTVGEVIELIDNKNLQSIKGIGPKTAKEIESDIKYNLENLEKEIKYFYTLPPNRDMFVFYLGLARAIFGTVNAFEKNCLLDCIGLIEVMQQLTPRERTIIEFRFGLNDKRTKCLSEVAKNFNISVERAKQIEAKALRKLRHPSRMKKIAKFM